MFCRHASGRRFSGKGEVLGVNNDESLARKCSSTTNNCHLSSPCRDFDSLLTTASEFSLVILKILDATVIPMIIFHEKQGI